MEELTFENRVVGRASYEGSFQAGKMHGKGVYTWPDGARYEDISGHFFTPKLTDLYRTPPPCQLKNSLPEESREANRA